MNPARLRPWVTRIGLVLTLVLVVLFVRTYGMLTVPPGMDTMPDYPPGTLCVIEKWPGEVQIGAVVFVEVEDGSLLTRVAAVTDGTFQVRHDDPRSRFSRLQGEGLGWLPFARIRGLVLSGFVPERTRDEARPR